MFEQEEFAKAADEAANTMRQKIFSTISEEFFVAEVIKKNMTDPLEVLNWYRNLYYKEYEDTEHGIMARAINDLFMKYKYVFR